MRRAARMRRPASKAWPTPLTRLAPLLLVSTLPISGCSLLRSKVDQPRADACVSLLESVDEAVADADAQDAGAYAIDGFAALRMDRFVVSFAPQAAGDPALLDAMIDYMRDLDRSARRAELSNLGAAGRAGLGKAMPGDLQQNVDRCAGRLAQADRERPARREELLRRMRIPGDYSQADRILGLYPLARQHYAQGVRQWQQVSREQFRTPRPATVATDRWIPAAVSAMDEGEIAERIGRAQHSPMGLLELDDAARDRLFARFAPVYRIEAADNDDRPGAPAYTDRAGLVVDTGRPTVYRRLSYTRFAGHSLPQLVFTLWFRQRPARSTLDPLAGRFDGLIFRVTLGADGRPLIYDTIRPCGCFHMFFPTASLVAREAPDPAEEWAFVPLDGPAPATAAGERIELRLSSHDHDLVGLAAVPSGEGRTYRLEEEDVLRQLSNGERGGTRSLYGPDGMIEQSKRLQRLTAWPMGVPSAGTMRQWGHHATAFVGRRHFDDADLIERRFAASH